MYSKTVDKGTVYERQVFFDPNTPVGQEEELSNLIATFLTIRSAPPLRLQRYGSKTERKRKSGQLERRLGRRQAHESWMANVKRDPLKKFPHPFEN